MIWVLLAVVLGGGLPPAPQHCTTGVVYDPRLPGREVWLYDVRRCEEFEPVCTDTPEHFCRPISVSLGLWEAPRDWDGATPASYPSPGSLP